MNDLPLLDICKAKHYTLFMSELEIRALVWDEVNEAHIWERHQITRKQVEEACAGPAAHLKVEETYNNRYLVLAPRAKGQLLAIVLAPKEEYAFYPVTARVASKKERHQYREWRKSTS